ncbi:Saposin-like type B [Macleaya cordata]|uniref:Saposin-like type B n=1 Tax=Macleaya cordata TaxID=56857 RepID=A0A200R3G0_MACCD|nr:Saposin-like type B [Macleaya cordata]
MMSLISVKAARVFFFFMLFCITFWAWSTNARILAMPAAAGASSIVQVTSSSCSQMQHDNLNNNNIKSRTSSSSDHDQQHIYYSEGIIGGGGGGGGGAADTYLILDNKGVCALCEQFTSQAIYYVTQNKTQSEIIDSLHQACSMLHTASFIQQECITLVDQHVSLFFQEIATIKPSEFCKKLNLCGTQLAATQLDDDHQIDSSQQAIYQDFCTLCHCAVATLLAKLKDPISQCEELLKKYGPFLLRDLEQLLETFTCNSIRAC